MDYREIAPPTELDGLVKTFWTLDVGDVADVWVEHRAMPDGCIEVIHRVAGRSIWYCEQPPSFAAGMGSRPAVLRLSGDASFVAARLWPWAWRLLDGSDCRGFHDDWIALDDFWLRKAPPPTLDAMCAALTGRLNQSPQLYTAMAVGRKILASSSVAEIVAANGRGARWVQRWFERYVGIAPRSYLRLVRFQEAVAALQSDGSVLANHAAISGYADQAHMAKDFRLLAGAPPVTIRRKAFGPFV